MLHERIYLTEDKVAYIDTYIPDNVYGKKKDAILVIPGGGYGSVCSDREGEPIALAFLGKGYATFVLHYSVMERAVFPQPLIEASLAVKHIKDNAEKYFVDPERVFATGFSAGGHLTASLGILWDMQEIYDATGMEYGENKVKGAMPIYPVISANVPDTHRWTFERICGSENPDPELLQSYCLETRVNENTVPMFIVHTVEDAVVPVGNSLVLAQALAKNKIPFELHIYPKAPHGMALCNDITSRGNAAWDIPHNAKWVNEADEWMQSIK